MFLTASEFHHLLYFLSIWENHLHNKTEKVQGMKNSIVNLYIVCHIHLPKKLMKLLFSLNPPLLYQIHSCLAINFSIVLLSWSGFWLQCNYLPCWDVTRYNALSFCEIALKVLQRHRTTKCHHFFLCKTGYPFFEYFTQS